MREGEGDGWGDLCILNQMAWESGWEGTGWPWVELALLFLFFSVCRSLIPLFFFGSVGLLVWGCWVEWVA